MWSHHCRKTWAGLQPGASLLSTQRGGPSPPGPAAIHLLAKRFTGNEPKPGSERDEVGGGAVSGLLSAAHLSGPGDPTHASLQTKQRRTDRATPD